MSISYYRKFQKLLVIRITTMTRELSKNLASLNLIKTESPPSCKSLMLFSKGENMSVHKGSSVNNNLFIAPHLIAWKYLNL